MGFIITTNVNALTAHAQGGTNNRAINNSLEKLGSGLRINKAADDGSGLAIADSLRSQANTLGQGIKNANDAIGIVQIADKAMDEQIKILDTIKTKATQAASDGQTRDTRMAIQKDISKLMDSLNAIAKETSFNGMSLLDGTFSNKSFQVGSYSNETVRMDIRATNADKIGQTRFETSAEITEAGNAQLKFNKVDGVNDFTLQSVIIGEKEGEGVGELARVVNETSDRTGISAKFDVQSTGVEAIGAGEVKNLVINNVVIGDITAVDKDSDGKILEAINDKALSTGVTAATIDGKLVLTSADGRGMEISADSGLRNIMKIGNDGGTPNTAVGGGKVGESDASRLETGVVEATATTITNLKINGVDIFGDTEATVTLGTAATANASTIINAINLKTDLTGVRAYVGGAATTATGVATQSAATNVTKDGASMSITVDIDTLTGLVEKGDKYTITIDDVELEYTTTGKEGNANDVVDGMVKMVNDAMETGIFDANSSHPTALALRGTTVAGQEAKDVRMLAQRGSTTSQTSAVLNLTAFVQDVTIAATIAAANPDNSQIIFEAADARGTTILIEGSSADEYLSEDATIAAGTNELALAEGKKLTTSFNSGDTSLLTLDGNTSTDVTINGVMIGDLSNATADINEMAQRINDKTSETGVEMKIIDANAGSFKLSRTDGSNDGINVSSSGAGATAGELKTAWAASTGTTDSNASLMIKIGDSSAQENNYGTISLVSNSGKDIDVSSMAENDGEGHGSIEEAFNKGYMTEKTQTLSQMVDGTGVTSKDGAMQLMDVIDSAIKMLDSIRADLGSTQNELTSTINNLSVTQVNVKSAESNIRDVDFAAESANFQKHNLLAQSGSYAMSQANTVQQSVMSLLK